MGDSPPEQVELVSCAGGKTGTFLGPLPVCVYT